MKFRSTHETQPLDFALDGVRYAVPVGGTCDVPDRIAFSVKLLGLPLEPVDADAPPAPAQAPAPLAEATETPADASPAKRTKTQKE